MSKRLALPLLSLALLFLLTGCAAAGPQPTVIGQELRPPDSERAPYQLIVTIKNASGGEGEIAVVARLRVRVTGVIAAQADQTATLPPRETLQLTFDLRPAAPGPYDVSVEATYPP